jgi:hypothetical protein
MSQVNLEAIKAVDGVMGVVQSDTLQIVFGPGTVNKVLDAFTSLTGIPKGGPVPDVAAVAKKNGVLIVQPGQQVAYVVSLLGACAGGFVLTWLFGIDDERIEELLCVANLGARLDLQTVSLRVYILGGLLVEGCEGHIAVSDLCALIEYECKVESLLEISRDSLELLLRCYGELSVLKLILQIIQKSHNCKCVKCL